jgi:hypothetical protein
MLCCALIALFAGQPAVLWAAIRARLFFPTQPLVKAIAVRGAIGASFVLIAELTLLGGVGMLGEAELQQSAARPISAPFYSRICSAVHLTRTK